MQLVLDTEGVALKVEDNCFFVVFGDDARKISPLKITSIALTANTLVSSSAIRLAVAHNIPIFIFHPSTGKPEARLDSVYFQNLPDVRRQQVLFELDSAATRWIVGLFEVKRQHQTDNLEFLKNRRPTITDDFTTAIGDMERFITSFEEHTDKNIEDARQSLLGIEGSIAKTYWQLVAKA